MRADIYLTQYGYVPTRSRATRMIEDGCVVIDGRELRKAGEMIDESVPHEVTLVNALTYVGRGGLKLERALDAFSIPCGGRVALDIGASTGGFTDCMLQRGATHVYAVDAGAGQLAAELRADARVTNIENCNARYLAREQLGAAFPQDGATLAVMDVSFISQTLILPCLPPLLADGADLVTLIKPQFEVGRANIAKGGIVRSDAARRQAVLRVLDCAFSLGLQTEGLILSPIKGGDGNTEYLVHLKKISAPMTQPRCDEAWLGGVGLS